MDSATRDAVRTIALTVIAAACIGASRAPTARVAWSVKETSEVFALPPSEHAAAISMGYRSALADVLWAHVMVSQGIHMQEKRRFGNLTPLIDTINELDPTFRDPYMYADALIAFQHGSPLREEVLKARAILERGMQSRPLDGDLWLTAGQYIAFIAPSSYLTDPEEQNEWKLAGAKILARAAELSGGDSSILWGALGGIGILEAAGEREAAIRFRQRALAVTDDEEMRTKLMKQLNELLEAHRADEDKVRQAKQLEEYNDYKALQAELGKVRAAELPFVSKTMFLVLGPPRDPAFCAGGAHADDARCALTWKDWAAARRDSAGR